MGNIFSSVADLYWKSTEPWIIGYGAIEYPAAVHDLKLINQRH